MTSFQVVRKKTPFQKHREEEEAKKKREEEEAARLYEDFVESFKGDEVGKTFVRGGLINPNTAVTAPEEAAKDPTPTKKPSSRYVPSFLPPGMATAGLGGPSLSGGPSFGSKDREKERNSWGHGRDRDRDRDRGGDKWNDRGGRDDKRMEDDPEREKERQQLNERGKIRNIDFFMEELKREQEMREKRVSGRCATRFDEMPPPTENLLMDTGDDGDPQTTNLYVGNLSPQVDENFLLRTFGRFGPIASVKIMWPRTEEEKRRARNCGFVAFMTRSAAQAAKEEMQGIVVYEYELRIGWGKAVNLPAQALPAPPPGQLAVRPKELELLQGQAVMHSSALPQPGAMPTQGSEVVVTPNLPDIVVEPPEDPHQRHIIDTCAMYVLDDGCAFEQAVMERGRDNPLFSFMFELCSPNHVYYMWRLFSFAQGDTLQRWRTEPFIMITGSGRWIPPPLPVVEAPPEKAAAAPKRRGEERALTDAQRDDFEDMLRALTLERALIMEAMGFALDNAEAAGEVVEVLSESLTLRETPIPTKVARLMLVSDILHNSSAPVKNASAYRTGFQARLPDILESFNELYRNITGRITAEALKERVLKVLQVWADWFLFSESYIHGLRWTFLRPSASGVPAFHSVPVEAPPDIPLTEEELAAAPAEALEFLTVPLDELERQCRFNGLSTRGGRAVMVTRLLSLSGLLKKEVEEEEEEEEEEVHNAVREERGRDDRVGAEVAVGVESVGQRARGRSEGSGWVEVSRNVKEEPMEDGGGSVVQNGGSAGYDNSAWPMYGDDDDGDERNGADEKDSAKLLGGFLPTTLQLPEPEIRSFGAAAPRVKVEKERSTDVGEVLATSKWARGDDSSPGEDATGRWEQGEAKGLQAGDREEKRGGGEFMGADARGGGGGEDSGGALGGLGLAYSSSDDEGASPKAAADKGGEDGPAGGGGGGDVLMDEERRMRLRQLELSLIEYRDSLEERGIRDRDDLERRVAARRKTLEEEIERQDEEREMQQQQQQHQHRSRSSSRRSRDGTGTADDSAGAAAAAGERGTGSDKKSRRSSEKERESSKSDRREEKDREPGSLKKRARSGSRSPRREKSKDKDRDVEKDRDRERDRDRDRDRERGRDKDREREKDKDRQRKDRDREKSSRDKDRDREKRSRRD